MRAKKMRLIDADDLIERIKEQYKPRDNNAVANEIVGDIIYNLIEEAPTECDLDSIIKQINNARKPIPVGRMDREAWHNIGYGMGLNKAIEIIKDVCTIDECEKSDNDGI